jgi:hypothetical protein
MVIGVRRLAELAIERVRVMERLQAIDDEAAELVEPVRKALAGAVMEAAEAEERLLSTWGHILPK